jgi:hypothetical protein
MLVSFIFLLLLIVVMSDINIDDDLEHLLNIYNSIHENDTFDFKINKTMYNPIRNYIKAY